MNFVSVYPCFFSHDILLLCQMFGNLMIYIVFQTGLHAQSEHELLQNSTGNLTLQPAELDLSVCGRNDCQDPDVIAATIEQYEPANLTTLYVALSIMSTMVLGSAVIGIFQVPEIEPLSQRPPDINEVDFLGSRAKLALKPGSKVLVTSTRQRI